MARWIAVLLFVATCAVYSPVRNYAFLNYDDPDYVTDNPHVRGGLTLDGVRWALGTTEGANWFPLTWISHMADVQLFGMRSGYHHLTSVLLHALSTVFLFLLLRRITGATWRAAFVALLFSLHPLHVESVAWIAERKDVLSGLFWWVTLYAYARYVERPTAGRYALVAAAFCCGLMAKPMIVTLPLVALLLDIWPLKRAVTKAVLIEKLPLLVLGAGSAVATYLAQQGGGAVLTAGQLPLLPRIGNALWSCLVYLVKLFWPSRLAVFYPFPAAPAYWQIIAAGLTLVLVSRLALRERARRPWLFVGWFWYLLTLLPVIGLIQVGLQARADRYTYIPSVGIAIVVAWGAAEIAQTRRWERPALAIAAAAALAWCAVTWSYLQSWRDSEQLFRRAIASTDGNYIAHNNLGVALRREGRIGEAITNFQLAMVIRPAYAEAQNNLAEALLAEGQVDEAMPYLFEALRLRPSYADAHVNFGNALARRGRLEEATAQFRGALQFDPGSAPAHAGLGAILTDLGQQREAEGELTEAVRLNPDYADAHYNLGRLFGLMGRPADAIAEFSQTIRLRPGDAQAHYNLGIAFAAQQKWDRAIEEFRAATRFDPEYANAHFNLGAALASAGRCGEAIAEFSATLRLRPEFEEARQNLEACRELHP